MLRPFVTVSRDVGAAAVPVDFSGVWKNDLKSEMDLQLDGAGRIRGVYRTGVGEPTPSEEFQLVGFVSGDLISFTVDFGKYGSLTSWAGQHTSVDGTEVIRTMWLLASNVKDADEPLKLWSAVLTGSDIFRR